MLMLLDACQCGGMRAHKCQRLLRHRARARIGGPLRCVGGARSAHEAVFEEARGAREVA